MKYAGNFISVANCVYSFMSLMRNRVLKKPGPRLFGKNMINDVIVQAANCLHL